MDENIRKILSRILPFIASPESQEFNRLSLEKLQQEKEKEALDILKARQEVQPPQESLGFNKLDKEQALRDIFNKENPLPSGVSSSSEGNILQSILGNTGLPPTEIPQEAPKLSPSAQFESSTGLSATMPMSIQKEIAAIQAQKALSGYREAQAKKLPWGQRTAYESGVGLDELQKYFPENINDINKLKSITNDSLARAYHEYMATMENPVISDMQALAEGKVARGTRIVPTPPEIMKEAQERIDFTKVINPFKKSLENLPKLEDITDAKVYGTLRNFESFLGTSTDLLGLAPKLKLTQSEMARINAFRSQRISISGEISKVVQRQGSRLSDIDVKNALETLPSMTDSKEVQNLKMDFIDAMNGKTPGEIEDIITNELKTLRSIGVIQNREINNQEQIKKPSGTKQNRRTVWLLNPTRTEKKQVYEDTYNEKEKDFKAAGYTLTTPP